MRLVQDALTFDDVLILPAESSVLPKDVNLTISLTSQITLQIPLLSAAMDTVTESRLAIAIAQQGGMGIIHKNMSIAQQAAEVRKVKKIEKYLPVGAAVGVGADTDERVETLIAAGVDILAVDTAHGHSKNVLDRVRNIKKQFPKMPVIAGNIATAKAAKALADVGADVVKVGIGPGSICITRVVTGVGVPQITAISNVAEALHNSKVTIIADGGIRYSGDVCKAIAAGAHVVMIGGIFAGTEESPGEIEWYQGRSYKSYRGMGSIGAMSQHHGSSDRYFQEGNINKMVAEGIEGRVPYKGSVIALIQQLMGGLQSGMGYTGCATINDMRTRPEFVRVTGAGMRESHAHDVQITKQTPNYQVEEAGLS